MHRKDVFAFRFLALSPAQLKELCEVCAEVVSRPARKKDGFVTGVFDLYADRDYSWVRPFIEEHGIPECDYGLFVSVSTSSDSEIVSVPQFVADIFRSVGGGLDFSFTVLSDE